jgi:penicillin amidase
MIWMKRILISLFTILALLGMSLYFFLNSLKPVYEGEKTIKGLSSETKTYFDNFGIPHIEAENEKDAMLALGYVHAQERLWQIELVRRIAPGRLSEIFGDVMIDNDKLFATLGIDDHSQKTVESLDKNDPVVILTQAYVDGINEYIANGKTPIEFTILGIEKTQFTIKDIFNIYGYMAFSFAMAHKTDPLMTQIYNKYGSEYLKDLGIYNDFNTEKIPSHLPENIGDLSVKVNKILQSSNIPAFIGSNSWVVGPEKTKNKKVLFANDPHIGYSQPGTWYEAHIKVKDYEIYGYYIPGTPFPTLGHNRKYAYGMTMLENDDVDFFTIKKENENAYMYGDTVLPIVKTQKVIKVKDAENINLNIENTHMGPLVNEVLTSTKDLSPIAMYWIHTQENNQLLHAVHGISHMKSLKDYLSACEKINSPGLNIMYGDDDGNIGWIASAKLYNYADSLNTTMIMNGSNGKDDKRTFIPFSQNPKSINPPSSYVYSANNQPATDQEIKLPGYYLPKDRARLINELLTQKNEWTIEDYKTMINDDISIMATEVLPTIVKTLENASLLDPIEKESLKVISTWKGDHKAEDPAPSIFYMFLRNYLRNTYEDEIGKEAYGVLITTHHIKQAIEFQLKNESSPWSDNIATTNKESRSDIIISSFKQTIKDLKSKYSDKTTNWAWKNLHTLELNHPLGQVALFRKYFNVGPHPAQGSSEVINNLAFSYGGTEKLDVTAGPSTRRIIDFSDIENSMSILPGGQSGNVMSKHYKDQALLYAKGAFRKMLMNQEEIVKTSTLVMFKPK